MSHTIEAVDKCAFEAWPAAEVIALRGWRLRFMHGVTRRGNSVWPCAARGGLSDVESRARVEHVEKCYADRGLPVAFQMTPLANPPELDAFLQSRGYALDAPTAVYATLATDISRSAPRGVATTVSDVLTDAWFGVSGRRGRFSDVAGVYADLLARIGPRARYALAQVDGTPCAVGLGVLGAGRLGIFSMLTLPEFRRRGAGRAILWALAACAVDAGAEEVYLQVEKDNAAALELYRSASFRELYTYHYRVRPK